jgi:competence protein ComEC
VQVAAAFPALALAVGSAAGLLLPDVSTAGLVASLIAVAALAVWALARGDARVLLLAVAAGFGAGGMLLAHHAWQEAWQPTLRRAFEERLRADRIARGRGAVDDGVSFALIGVLRTDAVARPSGISLSLDVTAIDGPDLRTAVRGGVVLTVAGAFAAEQIGRWRAGRTIRASARLERPARYLNPGVPDEERALAGRGTTLVGTVKSAALVEVIARGSLFSEAAAATRASARAAIDAAVGRWSRRATGIVRAIVIGDRAALDDDVERHLQEAGTYHVMAISGGNIAVLSALTLAAFRVAGVLGRAAMLAAIGGLVAYGAMVGGGMSVTRATLMAVLYFAARAMDLRAPPLNALGTVALVMIAALPLSVSDPGFLLTCGATGAILAILPAKGRLALVTASFVASIAAEAILLPMTAWFFARVTVAGPVFGLAAIPLMAVTQVAGMAVIPAARVSPTLAALAGWVASAGAEGLVRSAGLIELAPALTWRVAPPAWWILVVYYAALVSAWTLWRWRSRHADRAEGRAVRRMRIAAAIAWAGAVIWIAAQPWTLYRAADARLRVVFLDVGQGDATLVRFPNGGTLLVDAGGLSSPSSFDVGDRVVAPVLRDAGVRRVQSLALTHGDADHVGGAPSILREFKPYDVWEGIPVPRLGALADLRETTSRGGIRWVNVQRGDTMAIDGVQVIVRHPAVAEWERQRVRNDDSIVIELLWRQVSIVLTGDIGKEAEHAVAPHFEPARLRIVKVPHHGSRSSSTPEFVGALQPRIAVVSAGRGNRFGHPAQAVLDRYRRAGAAMFRTDRDGAVTVETDGEAVEVTTYTGRRFRAG